MIFVRWQHCRFIVHRVLTLGFVSFVFTLWKKKLIPFRVAIFGYFNWHFQIIMNWSVFITLDYYLWNIFQFMSSVYSIHIWPTIFKNSRSWHCLCFNISFHSKFGPTTENVWVINNCYYDIIIRSSIILVRWEQRINKLDPIYGYGFSIFHDFAIKS